MAPDSTVFRSNPGTLLRIQKLLRRILVQKIDSFGATSAPIPLSMVWLLAFVVHAPLLLMKLPLKSYDTNFHIFFASQYANHWFQPWNAKWYAGFSQTTYPPLPQQWLALLSHVVSLDMAYMLVQFAAILLLTLGVYRFAKLWVNPRAASFAALATVFLDRKAFLFIPRDSSPPRSPLRCI